MIITAKKGREDKIHLSIDGEYTATVDERFWYSSGFISGDEISQDELDEFLNLTNARRAYNRALDIISLRDHSSKELAVKLRKNFDEDAVENAIERLIELGLIDDERYAEKLAEYLLEKKSMSPNFIRMELIRKGVPSEIAQNTVDEIEVDPKEQMVELIKRKYINKINDEKSYKRVFNSLLRLGYSYGDVRSALNEVLSDYMENED